MDLFQNCFTALHWNTNADLASESLNCLFMLSVDLCSSFPLFSVLLHSLQCIILFPTILLVPVCYSWHTSSSSPLSSILCFFLFLIFVFRSNKPILDVFNFFLFLPQCLSLLPHDGVQPCSLGSLLCWTIFLPSSCPQILPEFHHDFQLHLQHSGTFFPVGSLTQHFNINSSYQVPTWW